MRLGLGLGIGIGLGLVEHLRQDHGAGLAQQHVLLEPRRVDCKQYGAQHDESQDGPVEPALLHRPHRGAARLLRAQPRERARLGWGCLGVALRGGRVWGEPSAHSGRRPAWLLG